jgi:hypothetical protein
LGGIDGLTVGDPVTAEQMRALFGCGLHPLAELRQQQLKGPDLTPRDLQEVTQLGLPFKIVDGVVSPYRLEGGRRIAAMNSAAGLPADAALPLQVGRGCGLRSLGSLPQSRRLARIRAKVVEASAADAWPRWLLRGSGRVW